MSKGEEGVTICHACHEALAVHEGVQGKKDKNWYCEGCIPEEQKEK